MLGPVFGVTRTRYCVCVVSAVRVLVESVIGTISDDGLAAEPCTTDPASLVISTRERDCAVPEAKVTIRDGITSVPVSAWRVKVLEVVAEPLGATDTLGVLVPTPRVTTLLPGATGPTDTPVDQLPLVSWVNILK